MYEHRRSCVFLYYYSLVCVSLYLPRTACNAFFFIFFFFFAVRVHLYERIRASFSMTRTLPNTFSECFPALWCKFYFSLYVDCAVSNPTLYNYLHEYLPTLHLNRVFIRMYLPRWKCASCVTFLWRLVFSALLMNASECNSVHVLFLIYLKNRHDWSSLLSSRRWIHTKSAFLTETQSSVGCPYWPKEAKVIIIKRKMRRSVVAASIP